MKRKFKLKKWHKIIGIVILFFALVLFFLSTAIRIYVTKNGEDLAGRKIDIEEIHINYFRCSIDIQGFTLFEKNGIDIFVHFDALYVNFSPWNLLRNEYAFSQIELKSPEVYIISSEDGFNFDDLIESSDTTSQVEDTIADVADPVKFLVQNLRLSNGFIRYEDKATNNIHELSDLSIDVPEIAWNNERSELGIDFILGENGNVSLDGDINQAEGTYIIHAKTSNIDISPFASYLAPYVDITSLKGELYSDISIKGEMENPLYLLVFGEAGLKNLNVSDMNDVHFFSSDEINVKLDSLDVGKENYCINTIRIDKPRITTLIDKEGMNIDKILAPYYADTLLSDTIVSVEDTLQSDSTQLHYAIRKIIINGASVSHTDLTLNRPFLASIDELNFQMNDFSDLATEVSMNFDMILNNSGIFKGEAVVDMLHYENISFEGIIADFNLISLSPYSEYYLAKSITKGNFNYDCSLTMTATNFNNNNSIKIVELEMGKKTQDKPLYKAPVGLALYVLKDRDDIIGFDLPVYGNPSDPTFKIRKIVWKTLEEFLLKTATAPFKAIANIAGNKDENIDKIPFSLLQDSLDSKQKDYLNKISDIILQKPDLTFSFSQITHPENEKELIAIREAKTLYIKSMYPGEHNPEFITQKVMSVKDTDPAFKIFLGISEEENTGNISSFCFEKAGREKVQSLYLQLMETRELKARNYLLSKGVPAESIVFKKPDLSNYPEEVKIPQFVIEISLE